MSNILLTLESFGQSNTSDFTIHYQPPIDLKGLQYKCALQRLDTYYSWYNISQSYQNNTFKYNNGVQDVILTIDDGLYSLPNLITEIQDLMVLEGDYTTVDGENQFDINFELDLSSGYVSLILTNGYSVDFTDRNIRTIFGFDSQNYNTSTVSPNKADINYGVNQILVHLNIVAGSSYVNNVASDVVFSFTPNHQENEEMHFTPNPIYLNVNTRNKIQNARLYFTDQRLRPLNLQQSPVTATFVLEPILTD